MPEPRVGYEYKSHIAVDSTLLLSALGVSSIIHFDSLQSIKRTLRRRKLSEPTICSEIICTKRTVRFGVAHHMYIYCCCRQIPCFLPLPYTPPYFLILLIKSTYTSVKCDRTSIRSWLAPSTFSQLAMQRPHYIFPDLEVKPLISRDAFSIFFRNTVSNCTIRKD